ncbi:hypothetical protein [Arthrobacter globiformis]|uniref:hypothetical protein n=1 Tax=Arthrobacter globiformis TaxID=1665 RepID=UPI0027809F3C|nr:hypothetical protein [Arthrobacter globiformis]MDQ0865396.1 hypothetical protein [Arthrobacter globiformis]
MKRFAKLCCSARTDPAGQISYYTDSKGAQQSGRVQQSDGVQKSDSAQQSDGVQKSDKAQQRSRVPRKREAGRGGLPPVASP